MHIVIYIYLFADDAKLFRHIASPNDNCLLQKGIDALYHWSQQWLLQEALLLQRDCAMRLSVQILQLQNIPF